MAVHWSGLCFAKLNVLPSRTASSSGRKKVFRLADVVQPLTELQMTKLTNLSVQRILKSEKAIARSGMAHVSRLNLRQHQLLFLFQ